MILHQTWLLRSPLNWTAISLSHVLAQNSPWITRSIGKTTCPYLWEETCFCALPVKQSLFSLLTVMAFVAVLIAVWSTLVAASLFLLSILADQILPKVRLRIKKWWWKRQLRAVWPDAQSGSRRGSGQGSQAECHRVRGVTSQSSTGVKGLLNYVVLTLIYLVKLGRGYLIRLRMARMAPLRNLQEPQ